MLLNLTLLNSKKNKKVKAKNQSYRNMKNQNAERQKPSFPKKQVENTDLYKPIMIEITINRKKCIKYSFVAPLNVLFYGLL